MAYTIGEWYEENLNVKFSNSGAVNTDASITRKFQLKSDESVNVSTAYNAFKSYLPTSDILYTKLESIQVEPDGDECDGRSWICRVTYKTSEASNSSTALPQQELDIAPETFSSEGGTSHITQGETETRYPCQSGTTLQDFQGGIGWNGDSFDGCDIVSPAFEFQLEKTFDYADVTAQVKSYWAEMTGTVNSATFNGYDAGTVLFTGVSASYEVEYPGDIIYLPEEGGAFGPGGTEGTGYAAYLKAHPKFKCTFKFKCAMPLDNATVAGASGVTKDGWDYLWILRAYSQSNGNVGAIPCGVYVNQVYPRASFANLGIYD